MPGISYTMPLRVRLYDLDLSGNVSCSTLLRFFEETAMQASSHIGFTLDWYNERGQFWVIRTMRLENLCPAHYQDDLEIRTWVSSMTRVRADRNYLVKRVGDGKVLARALANWVYLDRKTMRPARIAPDIVEMFIDGDPPAVTAWRTNKIWAQERDQIARHAASRARYYEADSAQHTNNAVYVDWLEEAIRETITANAHQPGRIEAASLWFIRHSIEYLTPALPGDDLMIDTCLVSRGKSAGNWWQEVRRAADHQLVARSESTTIWVDQRTSPTRWPEV